MKVEVALTKLSDDILAELSALTQTFNGDGTSTVKIERNLDRALYLKVNEVLVTLGGKWQRREKVHAFPTDIRDALENVILTGQFIKPKDEYGYFPTPEDVASRLIRMAAIGPGMRILEPSAGQGHIARLLLVLTKLVACVEILEANAKILREMTTEVWCCDFLTLKPRGQIISTGYFDRVVMNPPFARQQDIDHVRHAYDFLKPGGRLVSVMSSSVTFRLNKKTVAFIEFCKSVEQHGGNYTIDSLPEGSFKASGTMVNTCILTLDKPDEA